jgi:hypothetical protein
MAIKMQNQEEKNLYPTQRERKEIVSVKKEEMEVARGQASRKEIEKS